MTSEELEISLRTEFENHLKDTIAAIRQDVAEFQKNFEAEFAKHRSQLDEAIRILAERVSIPPELNKGFAESVVEHLRLARDEGAQITAAAFGEAEKLRTEVADTSRYDVLRNAINDISSQGTQAAILRSLVEHASEFAPRGAFFILKNEQFVGWKVFGSVGSKTDADAQAVRFPATDGTILAQSVNTLSAAEGAYGSYEDDEKFLGPLDLGRPDRMYAVPLTARGRGVAVLYADYGTEGISLNKEALETLVRVAGLTVELRAAVPAVSAPAEVQTTSEPSPETAGERPSSEYEVGAAYEESPQIHEDLSYGSTPEVDHVEEIAAVEEESVYEELPEQPLVEHDMPAVSPFDAPVEEPVTDSVGVVQEEEYSGAVVYEEPVSEAQADAVEYEVEYEYEGTHEEQESAAEPATQDHRFETFSREPIAQDHTQASDQVEPETSFEAPGQVGGSEPFDAPVETVSAVEEPVDRPAEPSLAYTNGQPTEAAEVSGQPAVEGVGTSQFKGRFSDRMLDLPIDVPEDEKKLHNNARRFARLLVSEIKLYNEQKVVEGREAADLYDRLREAIDRSREMYDKRVESHVADKFDYFHYELVNSLAEGDSEKLGANYPGAVV
ncbi:MAG TPA: hypothetical protein PKD24_07705 [Pyrinomonadaceae bacterium]|nr:hypothetical protein [Pyrinomonadaceae bacterium]